MELNFIEVISKMRVIMVVGLLLINTLLPLASPILGINGTVWELDDSNFDTAISTFDYVFVDFHAPWCGHCKRLSPQLDEAAPILAGLKKPVAIAKVNADKYTRLARKYDVDGYPTLKLFIHGVPETYIGPRKADLLVRNLKKFVARDVSVLDSDSAIKDFLEEAGTSFPVYIGFGLHAAVISDLAINYSKKAWFSVAEDFSEDLMVLYDFDKVPALVSLRPSHNEQSVFYGPFEGKFLEDFVKQNLLPLCMPINDETVRLLRDDERKIVLTIVEDEDNWKSKNLIKLLKASASANSDFMFGYVGVKQWSDFADSFEANKNTKLPKMIVWDGNEEYLSVIGSDSIVEEEDQGAQITRFLEGYREGRIQHKRISGPSLMGFLSSPIGLFSVSMFVILIVAVVFLIIQMIRDVDTPPGVGTLDQAENARTIVPNTETKDYQPGEKED